MKNNKVINRNKVNTTIIIVILVIVVSIIEIIIKNEKEYMITDNEFLYDKAISYLENYKSNTIWDEIVKNEQDVSNFKVFIEKNNLAITENHTYKYAYMWILENEYYMKDSTLLSLGETEAIYKFTFLDDEVIKFDNVLSDSSNYYSSLKRMSSSEVLPLILEYDRVSQEELENKLKEDVINYYKSFIDEEKLKSIL